MVKSSLIGWAHAQNDPCSGNGLLPDSTKPSITKYADLIRVIVQHELWTNLSEIVIEKVKKKILSMKHPSNFFVQSGGQFFQRSTN